MRYPSQRPWLLARGCALALSVCMLAAPSRAQQPLANTPRAPDLAGLRAEAQGGDAKAEFALGDAIENRAFAADAASGEELFSEAAHWYKLAADQGHAAAANNLGAMYVDGRGVRQDVQQGASYYRRAVSSGNHEAQTNLAVLLLKHRIPGDPGEAVAELTLASDAGFAIAQAQLAQLYIDGVVVPRDETRAAVLFKRAALQRDAWGEYGYALLLQSGTGVARDLPLAESWMEHAADAGLPAAQFDLANMLETGVGIAPDKKRADRLLHEAAARGEPRARARLDAASPGARPAS